ncbi:MAG: hypothetical protein AAFW68_02870 [Pseudomonadota bacterium]
MIRALLLISFLIAALIGTTGWYFYANQDVLDLIEGKWELDPEMGDARGSFVCEDAPQIIEIDKKNLRITSTRGNKSKVGNIIVTYEDSFWVKYDNEQVIEDNGFPVAWLFILVDRNTLAQIRTDWLDEDNNLLRNIPKRVRCN